MWLARMERPIQNKVMRADQVYYDLTKNKALALQADLEFTQLGVADPVHFASEKIMQLSTNEFKASRSSLTASKLPADPGLKLTIAETTIYEQRGATRRTIFGGAFIDRETGEDVGETSRTF